MRNRAVETGLILAVAAFTMLSVGTYISDMNRGSSGGQGIADVYQKVEHWIVSKTSGATTSALASGSSATQAALSLTDSSLPHSRGPSTTINQLVGNSGQAGAGLLSSANDTRMLNIAQTLAQNLTAADWTKIMSLLQSNNVATAQHQLAAILHSKLSPSDAAWLKSNFSGKQAFDKTDVVLLQQTLNELRSMFTPSEQKLLQRQLEHFGVALNE